MEMCLHVCLICRGKLSQYFSVHIFSPHKPYLKLTKYFKASIFQLFFHVVDLGHVPPVLLWTCRQASPGVGAIGTLAAEGIWPWGYRQEGGAIRRTSFLSGGYRVLKIPHPRSLYFLLDLWASFDLETNPFFLSLFLFPPSLSSPVSTNLGK